MQERVMEIVSILIKKLLLENGKLENADDLLSKLAERGFSQEEIDSALELIYSLPGSEEDANYLRHRVLTSHERGKLTGEAQAFLYQVLERGLLAKHEFELLLWEASLLRIPELGRGELEMLLANIIDDPQRLFLTGVHLKSAVSSEDSIN